MERRDFLKLFGAAGAGFAIGGCAKSLQQLSSGNTQAKRPNFVFILVDDMGWRDTGCYGSMFYQTPNINLLASQSMLFTDAYAAAPVCSPTRASIMTGKCPARLHLTDYIPGGRKGKLKTPAFEQQMPLEEFTIAEALKEAGYVTAAIGKWHLGKEPFSPEHQGFDINIGGCEWGMVPSHFYPYNKSQPNVSFPNLTAGKDGEYMADRLTDEAVKFIEANTQKPFFLYLAHYAVHTPLEAKKAQAEKYEKKAAELNVQESARFAEKDGVKTRIVQDHAVYAAMVDSVDQSVGRIMETLKRLKLDDNTVIIFTSDNGGLATSEGWPTANLPLRGGKGWLYEGGIREPLLVKWPGVTKPGTVCNEPVMSTDFYPTMLEIAKLGLKPQQHKDGMSIVPLLKGKSRLWQRTLCWHYPHYSNQGGPPSSAIRKGDYKLIEFFEDGHTELYNLKDDIGETKDMSAAMPEKSAELLKLLRQWQKQVDASMPSPDPDYKPRS